VQRINSLKVRFLGDKVLQATAWEIAEQLGWETTSDAEYVALTRLQADAFVTKFQPNGNSLTIAFSTYLGGTGIENSVSGIGHTGDIAVDAAGTAHVTGVTRSADFPVTPGAHDTTFGGFNVSDAFYARLSSTGQLLYATYLGGTATDAASGVALGPGGVAYVFGHTSSDAGPRSARSGRSSQVRTRTVMARAYSGVT
jgi:hypothetical protein